MRILYTDYFTYFAAFTERHEFIVFIVTLIALASLFFMASMSYISFGDNHKMSGFVYMACFVIQLFGIAFYFGNRGLEQSNVVDKRCIEVTDKDSHEYLKFMLDYDIIEVKTDDILIVRPKEMMEDK